MSEFSELVGKTLVSVAGAKKDSEEIVFMCSDGTAYKMYHQQDCCESVWVEDVCGNPDTLLGSPLVIAEESCSSDVNPEGLMPPERYQDSFTWTFYRLASVGGSVTIRWYGESNGYYSESVDFVTI